MAINTTDNVLTADVNLAASRIRSYSGLVGQQSIDVSCSTCCTIGTSCEQAGKKCCPICKYNPSTTGTGSGTCIPVFPDCYEKGGPSSNVCLQDYCAPPLYITGVVTARGTVGSTGTGGDCPLWYPDPHGCMTGMVGSGFTINRGRINVASPYCVCTCEQACQSSYSSCLNAGGADCEAILWDCGGPAVPGCTEAYEACISGGGCQYGNCAAVCSDIGTGDGTVCSPSLGVCGVPQSYYYRTYPTLDVDPDTGATTVFSSPCGPGLIWHGPQTTIYFGTWYCDDPPTEPTVYLALDLFDESCGTTDGKKSCWRILLTLFLGSTFDLYDISASSTFDVDCATTYPQTFTKRFTFGITPTEPLGTCWIDIQFTVTN